MSDVCLFFFCLRKRVVVRGVKGQRFPGIKI